MYDERKKNLDEFINEAGKATRAISLVAAMFSSVTKEGFVGGTAPTKGAEVGIGTVARLMPLAKVLVPVWMLRSLVVITYYVIKIGKTEGASCHCWRLIFERR